MKFWFKRLLFICLIIERTQLIICEYDVYYMDTYCSSGKNPSAANTIGVITLGKESCTSVASLRAYKSEYPNNGKCEVTIKAPTNYGLTAVIKYASFRQFPICSLDRDELLLLINKTVQFNITSSVKVDIFTEPLDNDIVVKFTTANLKDPTDGKGFEIIFTAYRPTDSSGSCNENHFNCDNIRCIHEGLHCDKVDNCGNNQDEYGCDYGVSSIWLLVAISGWLFAGFTILSTACWVAFQKMFDLHINH